MFALTFFQLLLWAVIAIVGIFTFVLVVWVISASVKRWGRKWTYPGVLLVAAAIAAAIIFPFHQGDGRPIAYNDGWDFVAASTAGSFHQTYGSENCLALFRGQFSAQGGSVFTTVETQREWVKGCSNAKAAMTQAEQNVTIPVKSPK